METRAGKLRDLNVARNADGFRCGGHPGKPQTRGGDAFAHDGASRKRNVFGMLDHGEIEAAAVVHNLPRQFGGGDGFSIVRDGNDACVAHGRNFGNVFSLAADAGGADGPDADVAMNPGAIHDEAGDRGIVVDGPGVGHAADGGESATRGGLGARLYGFGILLPRFAKVDVHVNKAGSDDEAGGVKHFSTVGTGNFSGCGDFGYGFSVEEDVADRVSFGCGIEYAAVLNQKHAQIPWIWRRISFQEPDACLPRRRPSAGREWPYEWRHRW